MSDRIDTDAVLHNAMIAQRLEDPHHLVDFEGDGWAAIVEKQRDELDFFDTCNDVGKEAKTHVLLDFAFPKIAHALGKTSLLIEAGYATIEKAFETMEQGEVLQRGLQRDCAVGACMVLLGRTLPEGFATELRNGFATRGELPAGAHAIYMSILSKPEGAQIRDAFVANCRDGQRYALDRHITTPAELAVALRQNPDFAARYQHDLAFKLGVDSVVWAQAHGQLPALEQQVPTAPVVTKMEMRG
jgi:hypothetical protein